MLPYTVTRDDGTPLGSYYDGLFWPSLVYTWRAFDARDTVLKVSGFGWPTAHIRPALPVPPHWLVLPPSQTTLWRLYAAGYDDTARYFARLDRRRRKGGSLRAALLSARERLGDGSYVERRRCDRLFWMSVW